MPLPLELDACKLKTVVKEREEMVDKITEHQGRVKKSFYKKARPRKFMEGDLVLPWDKRHEPRCMH